MKIVSYFTLYIYIVTSSCTKFFINVFKKIVKTNTIKVFQFTTTLNYITIMGFFICLFVHSENSKSFAMEEDKGNTLTFREIMLEMSKIDGEKLHQARVEFYNFLLETAALIESQALHRISEETTFTFSKILRPGSVEQDFWLFVRTPKQKVLRKEVKMDFIEVPIPIGKPVLLSVLLKLTAPDVRGYITCFNDSCSVVSEAVPVEDLGVIQECQSDHKKKKKKKKKGSTSEHSSLTLEASGCVENTKADQASEEKPPGQASALAALTQFQPSGEVQPSQQDEGPVVRPKEKIKHKRNKKNRHKEEPAAILSPPPPLTECLPTETMNFKSEDIVLPRQCLLKTIELQEESWTDTEEEEDELCCNNLNRESRLKVHPFRPNICCELLNLYTETGEEEDNGCYNDETTRGAANFYTQHLVARRNEVKPYSSEGNDSSQLSASLMNASIQEGRTDCSEYFDPDTQHNSLVGMQVAIRSASEQVSSILKSLVLSVYSTPNTRYFLSMDTKQQQFLEDMQPMLPYSVIAAIDNYTVDFEEKVRSGQFGLIFTLSSNTKMGVTYICHRDKGKEHTELQLEAKVASVKSKAQTNGLAAIVTYGSNKTGFTGNIVGYYGRGEIKNTRVFTHNEQSITAIGNPNSMVTGGLMQIGYTLPILKKVTVTPYIEGMMSVVEWRPYREKRSIFSSEFSKNKEQVLENNIGLRSQWALSPRAQLQAWIVRISGTRKANGLVSYTRLTPLVTYEVLTQRQKKKYSKTDVGISYEVTCGTGLCMGINGTFCLEKIKKTTQQSSSIYLRYTY